MYNYFAPSAKHKMSDQIPPEIVGILFAQAVERIRALRAGYSEIPNHITPTIAWWVMYAKYMLIFILHHDIGKHKIITPQYYRLSFAAAKRCVMVSQPVILYMPMTYSTPDLIKYHRRIARETYQFVKSRYHHTEFISTIKTKILPNSNNIQVGYLSDGNFIQS